MSTQGHMQLADGGLGMLRRLGRESRLLAFLAFLLSLLVAFAYGEIMHGMSAATFDAPRTRFWIAFTIGLGLICLFALLTPWPVVRGALLCGAAGGFAAAAVLSLFSVGPLFIVPALVSARAVSVTMPARDSIPFYLGAAVGLLLVEAALVLGLVATA